MTWHGTGTHDFVSTWMLELDPTELPDDQIVPDSADPLPDEEPIKTDPVEPEEE